MQIDHNSFNQFNHDNLRIFEKDNKIYAEDKSSWASKIKNFLSKTNITQRFGNYSLQHISKKIQDLDIKTEDRPSESCKKIQSIFDKKLIPIPLAPESTSSEKITLAPESTSSEEIKGGIRPSIKEAAPKKNDNRPQFPEVTLYDSKNPPIVFGTINEGLIADKDRFLKTKECFYMNDYLYNAAANVKKIVDILQESEDVPKLDKYTQNKLDKLLNQMSKKDLLAARSVSSDLGLNVDKLFSDTLKKKFPEPEQPQK